MKYPVVILLLVGLRQTSAGVHMDKLADSKMCGDAECSYVLSVATALDDFIAPDCRFINIRKGQMVYVYSKLVPEEGAGDFWSGSVGAHTICDMSLSSLAVGTCDQLGTEDVQQLGATDADRLVYSDRYVDQMGIIGYFPASVVKETYKFTEDTVTIPTAGMDFFCD